MIWVAIKALAWTSDWGWQRACLWSAWIVLATRSAQLSILSVLRFCFYMKGSFLNNSSLLIVFSIHNSYWILWIMQIYLWPLPSLLRCCCVELLKGSWHNTQVRIDGEGRMCQKKYLVWKRRFSNFRGI